MKRSHIRVHVLTVAALAAIPACRQPAPSNTIRVSGHVEATEVHVAAEVGGRLVDLRVTEGDRVAPGDLIALLDTSDIELQIGRVGAERAAVDAQLRLLLAGAPLLGLQGNVLKTHGSCNCQAFMSAIRIASEIIAHDMNEHASADIEKANQILQSKEAKTVYSI